jgi:hypothetical protein
VLAGRVAELCELHGAAVRGAPSSGGARRALKAYRERLGRIDAELGSADAGAEAGAMNKEREALLAELSAATGLGGRPRVAGAPTERMRKAVTCTPEHRVDWQR